MVFQDPQSSLHPFYRIGNQIAEAYRAHHHVSKRRGDEAGRRDARPGRHPATRDRRARSYPHEFSGGMRQRAMIALGLVNDPKLLIADEPTTALDVTVQAQILDLLKDLQREFGSAIVLITHDLAVVAEVADDILVMYAGRGRRARPGQARCSPTRCTPTPGACCRACPRPPRSRTACARSAAPRPACVALPTGCSFHPRCDFQSVVRRRRLRQHRCPSSPPRRGTAPG